MRIYHSNTNQLFDSIEIYLTLSEAKEMQAQLDWLIENPNELDVIINEQSERTPNREISLIIYTSENLKLFNQQSRDIIEKNI